MQKLCKCPSCLLPGGANQFPGGFTPAVDHHLFTAHPVSALGVHPPLPVGKPPHSNTLFPSFLAVAAPYFFGCAWVCGWGSLLGGTMPFRRM